jgi:hypothetical protein
MPVSFCANFLGFFKWLAHMLLETTSEIASKSVTETGKKVPLIIRSLGKMGSKGGWTEVRNLEL